MFFKATCCWSDDTTIQSTHKYYKISYPWSTTALNDLVLKYFIFDLI